SDNIPYLFGDNAEKAARMVNNFPKMSNETILTELSNVLLMNPYADGLYAFLLDRFGDKNGDLGKIAEYFGISYVIRKKEKDLKVFFSELKPQLAISEESTIAAKDKFTSKCEVYGYDGTFKEEALREIDEKLVAYDVKARTFENHIFATRKEVDDLKYDSTHIEELLSGLDFDKNEEQAKEALCRLENYKARSPLADTAIKAINEHLGRFNKEAHTWDDVFFDTREEKAAVQEIFEALKIYRKDFTGVSNQLQVDSIIDKVTNKIFDQSKQKDIVYSRFLEEIFQMTDTSNEEATLQAKQIFLEIASKLNAQDSRGILREKYLTIIRNYDEQLEYYDSAKRTANNILFSTREEKKTAQDVFDAIDDYRKGKSTGDSTTSLDSIIDLALKPILSQCKQKDAFYANILDSIYNTLDITDENTALKAKEIILSIGSRFHAQEHRGDLQDRYQAIITELDNKLSTFDEQMCTVQCKGKSFIFNTREEADKARPDIEALDTSYQKYLRSPQEGENFFALLKKPGIPKEIFIIYKKMAIEFVTEKTENSKESGIRNLMKINGRWFISAIIGTIAFYFFVMMEWRNGFTLKTLNGWKVIAIYFFLISAGHGMCGYNVSKSLLSSIFNVVFIGGALSIVMIKVNTQTVLLGHVSTKTEILVSRVVLVITVLVSVIMILYRISEYKAFRQAMHYRRTLLKHLNPDKD
ncbi:MAG: hypothetical protein LBU09_04365, partial [Endomicrobium sp.]|nr:hypothetical protein [Endomicrobium sp.]